MARVTVFVDDVVQGHLPLVCVRTGEPADGMVRVDHRVGGLGALWLLVLLGPLGWLVLALMYAGAGRERLTVRLPYQDRVFRRDRRSTQVQLGAFLVAVAAIVLQLVVIGPRLWLLPVAGLALAIWAVTALVGSVERVGIELDASRRWVTLTGVDDEFAAAVRAQQADQGAR